MSNIQSGSSKRSLPELVEESNQLKEQSIKIREKLVEVNEQIRNLAGENQGDRYESAAKPDRQEPKS